MSSLADVCLFLLSFLILTQTMLNVNNSAPSSEPHTAKRKSNRSAARAKQPNFGEVIRSRRRELDLTQDEVASRIKTSTPYVGHLESSKRHPSDKIVTRLAEVLGLDSANCSFSQTRTPRLYSLRNRRVPKVRFRPGTSSERTNNFDASTTSRMARWRCCRKWHFLGKFSRLAI